MIRKAKRARYCRASTTRSNCKRAGSANHSSAHQRQHLQYPAGSRVGRSQVVLQFRLRQFGGCRLKFVHFLCLRTELPENACCVFEKPPASLATSNGASYQVSRPSLRTRLKIQDAGAYPVRNASQERYRHEIRRPRLSLRRALGTSSPGSRPTASRPATQFANAHAQSEQQHHFGRSAVRPPRHIPHLGT